MGDQFFWVGKRAAARTRSFRVFPTLPGGQGMASWRDSQFEHWAGQGGGDAPQMAVMTSAIANGGKVFWPRLVAGWKPGPDSR